MDSYGISEQVITSVSVCVLSVLVGCFVGAAIAYDWFYIIHAAVYMWLLCLLVKVHLKNMNG